uniref:Ribosome biogenesis GTPase A n=1 Tax=Fervidobacterium nodosum TaxID=2424 RepID=A0A7C5Y973_9BACT
MSEEKVSAWYPGHVQKAKRQIKENLKKIDIVIIVLDARAPVATTSFELKLFKDKTKIFLLNKSDLSNEQINKLWLEEISREFPTLLVNKDTQRKEIISTIKKVTTMENPHIAVVGVPNVGKSTIINKILGRHKAKTGAQPGITRGVQWVNVEGVTVLDSPGILYSEIFSKEIAAKLLLIGSLPIENVPDDIYEVAFDIYKSASNLNGDLYTTLEEFGRKRGLLKKGGIVDLERARFLFFKDLSEGKLGRFTYDTDFAKFWEVLRNG